MAAKQKYYVVWQGHEPGIYKSWAECQLQIKGYPGAKYKAFKSLEEAESAFVGNYTDSIKTKARSAAKLPLEYQNDIIQDSWSVDAACSGNPGKMEYQGVYTADGSRIFHVGPLINGTNNIGEFLALVHALALLKKQGKDNYPIYTDSRTALSWIKKKKVKTVLKKVENNKIIFELIARAEKWIRENEFDNPIHKWDTKNWGEIPADFGRK